MRRQCVFAVVLVLLCASTISLMSVSAQGTPPQYVNTWHYATGDEHEKITFYNDGHYILFYDSQSEFFSSPTCEQTTFISRGAAAFSADSVTLTQEVVLGIEKPGCTNDENNRIQSYRPDVYTYPIAYNSLLESITFNGVIHTRTQYDDAGLQFIPITAREPVPPELVGEWSYEGVASTIGGFGDLNISADGSFTKSFALATSDGSCSSGSAGSSSGYLVATELIMTINTVEGEQSPCSGGTYPVGQSTENKTWWMAYSPTVGDILYVDGTEYTRTSGNSTPPRPDGGSDSSSFTPPTTSVVSGNILYQEDFDVNTVDWETDSGSGFFVDLVDGKYVMGFGAEEERGMHWLSAPGFTDWSLAPQFTAPYTFEVDVRGLCSLTCGVGLLFNVHEGYTDLMEMIYVYTLPEGRWGLQSMQSLSSGGAEVDHGLVFEPINIFDGATHALRLEVENGHVAFYIDDQFVSEASGQWGTGGSIGLSMLRDLGTDITVEFDNVRIS